MEIGESLKQIRQNTKFTQEGLATEYMDRSAYSRVERNIRSIRIRDLRDVLHTMSINTAEFFSLTEFDDRQQSFRNLFTACSKELNNPIIKEQMIHYFNEINRKTDKSLRELCNYISIKNYFCQFWKELPEIDAQDKKEVYAALMNKSYFYHYDYALLSNMIPYFSKKDSELLIKNAIPIKDKVKRDSKTKSFACCAMLNFVNIQIYNGELKNAEKSIDVLKKHVEPESYLHKLELYYLENLLEFSRTGAPEVYKKLLNYIDLRENIGDTAEAAQIRYQVQIVTTRSFEEHKNTTPNLPMSLALD